MSWIAGLAVTFYLFVISTMISQSAMDAFATLSGIFLIGYWIQQKRSFRLFPKTGMEWPIIAFSIAVILSFLGNWDTQTLALKRIVELKWILNFYLIVASLRVLKPTWKALERVQIVVWISSLFALLAPILGYDVLETGGFTGSLTSGLVRVGGFFSNPMTFAHLHALFFFLLVGLTLYLWKEKPLEKVKIAALTSILGLALLLTLTRGVWVGAFIGLVCTGFLFHKRWGLIILFGTIALGAAAFFWVPSIQDRALHIVASNSYDSERLWIWKANWQIFLDHPIFGIGYGENTLALKDYYGKIGAPEGLLVSHSHNQYLNILAGLGVVGFLSYLSVVLGFLVLSLKSYFKAKTLNLPAWKMGLLLGAIGAQICFLVGGLTESNFEHSKVRYVLLLVWAIPFWIMDKAKSAPDSRS